MLNENAFIFDKKRIINMNIMIELTTANFFSKQKVGKLGTMYNVHTYQRFLLIGINPSSRVVPFKANPIRPVTRPQEINRIILCISFL